jgi:N-acetyl-anhydromuramyl-L-alanine amidase AmpD
MWRLRSPHVIVEHYTDGTTFGGAWETFASNGVHLGELPGVCAHFLIDTDGTIYQVGEPAHPLPSRDRDELDRDRYRAHRDE